MNAKEAAARSAVSMVKDGMVLGLGTGSTAAYALQALKERIEEEKLQISGIPTSVRSEKMALEYGIPLTNFNHHLIVDMTIDGADEVDEHWNLIKGGGGALMREKVVASASREMVVICDASKLKQRLGQHALPVAVLPFGHEVTAGMLQEYCLACPLRRNEDGSVFVTDDGLYVYDMFCDEIREPARLQQELIQMVGVMEIGLFVDMASHLVVGYEDGQVETLSRTL